ncbi:conserved hypothetical protein [Parafrankia sp. EUN1f]|nr:conserved hypothetical protein [Parafrankia sp. EUN1f]
MPLQPCGRTGRNGAVSATASRRSRGKRTRPQPEIGHASPPRTSRTRRHPHCVSSGTATRGTLKPPISMAAARPERRRRSAPLHSVPPGVPAPTGTPGRCIRRDAGIGLEIPPESPATIRITVPRGRGPEEPPRHRDPPAACSRPSARRCAPRRTRLTPADCERTSNGAATSSARAAGRKAARPDARAHRAARAPPASSSAVICHNNRIDRDSISPRREFRSVAGEASLRKCSRDRGHLGPR